MPLEAERRKFGTQRTYLKREKDAPRKVWRNQKKPVAPTLKVTTMEGSDNSVTEESPYSLEEIESSEYKLVEENHEPTIC